MFGFGVPYSKLYDQLERIEKERVTKMISMDKKYTVEGRPARVICVDKLGQSPVIALVNSKDGKEVVVQFNENGIDPSECWGNLVEVPPDTIVYLNDYGVTTSIPLFNDKAVAENANLNLAVRQGLWELNLTTKKARFIPAVELAS